MNKHFQVIFVSTDDSGKYDIESCLFFETAVIAEDYDSVTMKLNDIVKYQTGLPKGNNWIVWDISE